jgi:hypothetical protein
MGIAAVGVKIRLQHCQAATVTFLIIGPGIFCAISRSGSNISIGVSIASSRLS